jgi:hypothetical protein
MSLGHGASIVRDGLSFQIDFANPKCYPGTGTTAFNLNKTGNFTFFGNTTVSNNVAVFNGTQGTYIQESSGLGNHGTNSFTYQILCNPKTSTSIDNAAYSRIFEQMGWPQTYHNLAIIDNGGNPIFSFSGRDLNQTVQFAVSSPSGTAILNQWYLLTTIMDRGNNKCVLYVNDTRYESNLNLSLGGIGDNDALSIPSTYAEVEMDMSCFIGYTKALTDTEVKQNFEALRGRVGL